MRCGGVGLLFGVVLRSGVLCCVGLCGVLYCCVPMFSVVWLVVLLGVMLFCVVICCLVWCGWCVDVCNVCALLYGHGVLVFRLCCCVVWCCFMWIFGSVVRFCVVGYCFSCCG